MPAKRSATQSEAGTHPREASKEGIHMAVSDAMVFDVLSACFGPTSKSDWEALTKPTAWADFLTAARHLLQEQRTFGVPAAPLGHAQSATPLSDYLTKNEVCHVYAPPSFEEKQAFAARHFTGGLPASAMPVESLYVVWSDQPNAAPFTQRKGLYQSDVALYMRDLVSSMGLTLPTELGAYPDHLSIECAVCAYLIDAGLGQQASEFWCERTVWLTDFRARLRTVGVDAVFYLALVDVMLGIRATQASCAKQGD